MFQQAIFKKSHYDGKGTYLQVYVPGIDLQDKYFIDNGLANGAVRLDDGRTITAAQQGLLYSVFNDIRLWEGEGNRRIGIEKVKQRLKANFCVEANIPMFSLSNVSVIIASDFIDYVLDFAFERDVPLTLKSFEMSKTVRNWSYLCFKRRKCTVCQKSHAEVHHLDSVGTGRNRNRVNHSKMLLIMLCREHHQEAHTIGDQTFLTKHYVAGIFVPVEIPKALNIRGDYGEEANR